ncbi:MAG: sigma-70 family RNA polymerase sigma factor [Candidatus Eisenbacteria bacterium]
MDETKPLAELTDEVLVERCQDNDHRAFTAIVDRYKHKVHWLVRRMVGNPEDEDLTQEVFVRAYQAMPGFQGRSSFRTWLYRIAHNLCLTELRRRSRRGEHVSLEEEGEDKVHRLLSGPCEDLEHEIERRDISRSVRTLVERLPVPYRTALTLFYLQQVRYEEIGEIMGIPLGTVKTYIHRGRLRLRELVLAESDLASSREGKQ